jgi:hypothetical protein
VNEHKYRIRLAGGLGPVARERFGALHIDDVGPNTELYGSLDQAGLFGVLQLVQVLGLELIALNRED